MVMRIQSERLVYNINNNSHTSKMTDKCYRVEFTAHLHRLTLALKMQCEIQVVWKRGQKICESGKVKLLAGQANFDRKISISCNMIFNTRSKIFKEKLTKFSIILTSEKGVKQAGQIELDVAEYINEKQLNKKEYDQKLSGCPDKNAHLTFTLTGVLKQEISLDSISQHSYQNSQNGSTQQSSKSSIIPRQQSQNSQQTPTRDRPKPDQKNENIKSLQQQNKKMKEEIKSIQKLRQQNEQLRKKIKNEEYKKGIQIKQKIEKYKKQIQKMKAEIRTNKKIQDETMQIQRQILNCKVKIMKAFNYASDYKGSDLVDAIQNYCGIEEK